ncbi:MAG: protein kinase, partial [bacterium]
TERGEVKILDFGLAKLVGAELSETVSTRGTIAYMSPEVIRGLPLDRRSDIWSLGVVCYELLTGELPFKGEYAEPLMYAILNEVPAPLNEYRDDFDRSLEMITEKLLQKEPEKRYSNLGEFLSDLEEGKPEIKVGHQKFSQNKFKRVSSIRKVFIGLFFILVFGMVGLYYHISTSSSPHSKPIAVMSFENQTGDTQYDYLQKAIPNLLISSLEQSGVLRVATWERLLDLLKQKNIQNGSVIDSELGFELCQMDGIETIILGSYTRAGDVFALDIKMLDVQSKELLQSASSQGHGVSSILTQQIDELSQAIFNELGISEQTTETIRPISEVTASSIEAYNFFIRGREEWEKRNIERARQFFERAIHLDSTFASAYFYLAKSHSWLGNFKSRNAAILKAKNYSNKATEKERLYIEAGIAGYLENNPENRIYLLQKIIAKYPQEKYAYFELAQLYQFKGRSYSLVLVNLNKIIELDPNYGLAYNLRGLTYMEMEKYPEAFQDLEHYASLSPGDPNPFDSMGELYLRTGKLEEALVKYKQANEVDPQFFYAYRSIVYIYALLEDYDQTLKWMERYAENVLSEGVKADYYRYQGFYDFWLGRLNKSVKEFQIATQFWQANEHERAVAFSKWAQGWIYLYMGDVVEGRGHLGDWIEYFSNRPGFEAKFCLYSGLADLRESQFDSVNMRLKKIQSFLPDIDPLDRKEFTQYHDLLQAELFMASSLYDKVIKNSPKISPLLLSPIHPENTIIDNIPSPLLQDILARAYHKNGNLDRAILEYEKLTTPYPQNPNQRLIHPIFYFKLAKLYEETGQVNKASRSYQKFLEIWKNADAGIPEVSEAKNSLTRLQSIK